MFLMQQNISNTIIVSVKLQCYSEINHVKFKEKGIEYFKHSCNEFITN